MTIRPFDLQRDREAARRIWREVGWIDKEKIETVDTLLSAARANVVELAGQAECIVGTAPGTLRYLGRDLTFVGVTGVATGYVARKQGHAARLAALTVAEDAAAGAMVAGLGMFEQGFYNQIGFGTGPYETFVAVDPAMLRLPVSARPPVRFSAEQFAEVHAARLSRWRAHGSITLSPPAVTQADLTWEEDDFGLGYRDGPGGALSHFVWLEANKRESGPWQAEIVVYQEPTQLLELLAMLKMLGDQVHLVSMQEPPNVQIQDLIAQPLKHWQITRRSSMEQGLSCAAYWQVRICDLPGCLAATRLGAEPVSFNLRLRDPIAASLPDDAAWRGVAGDYVVTLGGASGAEPGRSEALPTLEAGVGAFTRMWLGVRPATALALTDDLAGPAPLLEALDVALRLPTPHLDWDF